MPKILYLENPTVTKILTILIMSAELPFDIYQYAGIKKSTFQRQITNLQSEDCSFLIEALQNEDRSFPLRCRPVLVRKTYGITEHAKDRQEKTGLVFSPDAISAHVAELYELERYFNVLTLPSHQSAKQTRMRSRKIAYAAAVFSEAGAAVLPHDKPLGDLTECGDPSGQIHPDSCLFYTLKEIRYLLSGNRTIDNLAYGNSIGLYIAPSNTNYKIYLLDKRPPFRNRESERRISQVYAHFVNRNGTDDREAHITSDLYLYKSDYLMRDQILAEVLMEDEGVRRMKIKDRKFYAHLQDPEIPKYMMALRDASVLLKVAQLNFSLPYYDLKDYLSRMLQKKYTTHGLRLNPSFRSGYDFTLESSDGSVTGDGLNAMILEMHRLKNYTRFTKNNPERRHVIFCFDSQEKFLRLLFGETVQIIPAVSISHFEKQFLNAHLEKSSDV